MSRISIKQKYSPEIVVRYIKYVCIDTYLPPSSPLPPIKKNRNFFFFPFKKARGKMHTEFCGKK
jgi:hypothetical protein